MVCFIFAIVISCIVFDYENLFLSVGDGDAALTTKEEEEI